MKIHRIIVFTLALILSCNASARSGLFPSFKALALGGAVIGALALNKACHDANGKLKPNCVLKKKSVDLDAIKNPDDINLLRSSHTYELRKALNEEQVATGMPPDPDDCDAHHIVPKREGRAWAVDSANNARYVLDSCNIDLNSVENGVYLPGKRSGAQCSGSYHKNLHSKKYYESIEKRLSKAQRKSCSDVMDELRAIKNDLATGGY